MKGKLHELRRRERRIMDDTRERRPLRRGSWFVGGGAALATLVICAAMQARAGDKAKTRTTPGGEAPAVVEISTKIIEVAGPVQSILHGVAPTPGAPVAMSDEQANDFTAKLARKKGVDIMSAPRVTTKSGQRATIEVTRDFGTEDKSAGKVKVGAFLTLLPQVDGEGGIKLSVDSLIREFDGFRDDPGSGKKLPLWLELKMKADVDFQSGTTAVLMTGPGSESARRVFLFLISAKLVPPAAVPAAAPAPEPASKVKAVHIILPRLEFKDASLDEAVEFLRIDTRGLDSGKQAPNIIVVHGPNSRDARITLSLRDVPLFDALRYAASLSNLELVADGDALILQPHAAAQPKAPAAKPVPAPKKLTNVGQRAKRIVLPRVDFQEATLDEALDFLRAKTRNLRNTDGDSLAVNIVLQNPPATNNVRLTLNLRDVSLSEVLRYVAQLANLDLEADENGFVLKAKETK